MMNKIVLFVLLSFLFQKGTSTISPDGKYRVTIEVRDEHDSETRYITKLSNNDSQNVIEIANCTRTYLESPNFYWDKDSKYLIYEQCSDFFKESRIKILNLRTKKTEFELMGLIGNRDSNSQQFDILNNILFYFDTSTDYEGKIPSLYMLDLRTRKQRKIYEFVEDFEREFPRVEIYQGKREVNISYIESSSEQRINKRVEY